ncbi:MAG: hypothetical protein U1E92_06080 [Moraxella osloensis]
MKSAVTFFTLFYYNIIFQYKKHNIKDNSHVSLYFISRRVFEALGHKLAQLSAKDTIQTKPLADIDFDSLQQALSNDKNAFHEHIPKLSKLLGKTPFGSYTKMATSLIPKASFDKATDAVFSQVGKLSQNWANFDLARDARFKDTLVASERQALARSIGDQNRALATLGGLSNLAGLPVFW